MASNHRGQPIGNPNTSHGGASARPMGRSALPRLSRALAQSTNESLENRLSEVREAHPMLGYTMLNLEPAISESDASHMLSRYREDRNRGSRFATEMRPEIRSAFRGRSTY